MTPTASLNRKALFAQIHHHRRKLCCFPAAHFIAPFSYALTVTSSSMRATTTRPLRTSRCFMYRQQIPIHNTHALHRHSRLTRSRKSALGLNSEGRPVMAFNMLLRQKRFTRRDTPDKCNPSSSCTDGYLAMRRKQFQAPLCAPQRFFKVFFRRVWGTEPQSCAISARVGVPVRLMHPG